MLDPTNDAMTPAHQALMWAIEDLEDVGINPKRRRELTKNLALLYVGLFF